MKRFLRNVFKHGYRESAYLDKYEVETEERMEKQREICRKASEIKRASDRIQAEIRLENMLRSQHP